ncbi:hypothetical protein ACI2OX_17555 [Bacillus sp. N9]
MRRITAVRFNGHQCFYLRNGVMKVMTFRNISEIKMNDLKKWEKLVQEVYQIDADTLSESLQFLEKEVFNYFNKKWMPKNISIHFRYYISLRIACKTSTFVARSAGLHPEKS